MLIETKSNDWNRGTKTAAPRKIPVAEPSKYTDGLMVVIAEERDFREIILRREDRHDRALFIGWALPSTVGDLLLLLQKGNPRHLSAVGWFPATIADVEMHQEALTSFRYRTDDENWYQHLPQIDAYLKELRKNIYAEYRGHLADDDDDEMARECPSPAPQTSTLLPQIKPAALKKARAKSPAPKCRRKNKTTKKQRQH